jgi:hypothetical protein
VTLAGRPPTPPRNGLYPDHWFRRTARLQFTRPPSRRRDIADLLAAVLVLLLAAAAVLVLLAAVIGLTWLCLSALLALLRLFGG